MRLPAGIAALLLAFVAGAAEAPKYSNPDDPAVLAADVLFDFDKHDLRPEAVPSLEKVAEVLRSRAGSPVMIEGHTDGSDDPEGRKKNRRVEITVRTG